MFRSPVALEEWIALDGGAVAVADSGGNDDGGHNDNADDPTQMADTGDHGDDQADAESNQENRQAEGNSGEFAIMPMALPVPPAFFTDPDWVDILNNPFPQDIIISFDSTAPGAVFAKVFETSPMYNSNWGPGNAPAEIDLTTALFDAQWTVYIHPKDDPFTDIPVNAKVQLYYDDTTNTMGFILSFVDNSAASLLSPNESYDVNIRFSNQHSGTLLTGMDNYQAGTFRITYEPSNPNPPGPPGPPGPPNPPNPPNPPGPNPPNPIVDPSDNQNNNDLEVGDDEGDDGNHITNDPQNNFTNPGLLGETPSEWRYGATFTVSLEDWEDDFDLVQDDDVGATDLELADIDGSEDELAALATFHEAQRTVGRLGLACEVLREQLSLSLDTLNVENLYEVQDALRQGDAMLDNLTEEMRLFKQTAAEFQAIEPARRDGVTADLLASGAVKIITVSKDAETMASALDAVTTILKLTRTADTATTHTISAAFENTLAETGDSQAGPTEFVDKEWIDYNASRARQGAVKGEL